MIIFAKAKNSDKKDKDHLKKRINLLSKLKKEMKQDDICHDICKEYGFDISIVDGIPMEFDDSLDVSAKTINSKIILNSKFINRRFEILMRYAVHELVHALQHMKQFGGKNKNNDNEDYLDNENELEAFQRQVEFQAREDGLDKAEEYVEDLIEYHEVPKHKKQDKKEELLERV